MLKLIFYRKFLNEFVKRLGIKDKNMIDLADVKKYH